MRSFSGAVAVVTGGGTGMGRELVRQLAAEGCHVATCDVFEDALDETRELAEAGATGGARIATYFADVADEIQLRAFSGFVRAALETDHVNLLFNNAGVAGGGGFVTGDRDQWDRTFAIDFFGVYYSTRAFLPLLMKAEWGRVVNTSSVNGLLASIGPTMSHTAYSSAKFAVRGFTESLITDFRINAPHLGASVVMPGHIGTPIVLNTNRLHGRSEEISAEELATVRRSMAQAGIDVTAVSDDDLAQGVRQFGEAFRDNAPTSAAQAATIILDGVREGRWRILVGADAVALDELVREDPEHAYDIDFWSRIQARTAAGPTS